AASYLEARRRSRLWYSVDERDRDPATFVHYLSRAVNGPALPRLSVHQFGALPAFARRFFDVLVERLHRNGRRVIDNYHLIGDAGPVQELIAAGIEEAPVGVSVLVLSRSQPPPAFATLRARRAMSLLEADALRLTPSEAQALARLQHTAVSRSIV